MTRKMNRRDVAGEDKKKNDEEDESKKKGFEAYVGLQLLRAALTGVVGDWQVMVCGILLVLMAVGNFKNTVETVMEKSRFKAKMKRSKSRAELN